MFGRFFFAKAVLSLLVVSFHLVLQHAEGHNVAMLLNMYVLQNEARSLLSEMSTRQPFVSLDGLSGWTSGSFPRILFLLFYIVMPIIPFTLLFSAYEI